MPIPYMGSKSKSASRIVNVIEAYTPNNSKIVVDLFTG
jgi:adenine-specific DNA methylase